MACHLVPDFVMHRLHGRWQEQWMVKLMAALRQDADGAVARAAYAHSGFKQQQHGRSKSTRHDYQYQVGLNQVVILI